MSNNIIVIRQTSISDKDLLIILQVDNIVLPDKTRRELMMKTGEIITDYEKEYQDVDK